MRLPHPPVAALALTLSLVPAAASAHELWLERAGSGLVLRYGHEGALVPFDAARVKSVRCLDHGATRELVASAARSGDELGFAGRCEAASAFLDWGHWSLTPDGEVNRPRTEVPQAVKAWASRQWAKWVDARAPATARTVLGDELELVPVTDLSRARRGDKITVRVLSGGKPVRDAVVVIDHKPIGESDSQGDVRLRIRSEGVEIIGATLRRKVATREADELVLEASLAFEVAR